MGHCQVRVPSDLNPSTNIGLTRSFSQDKIMEMECELLISNFKGPKTIALVKEKIGHFSDGSSSYCTGALKLGLKKAFKLNRPPGVRLRCTYSSCAWYGSYVPSPSAGSGTYCQNCLNYGYGSRYLQCSGCGYNRTGGYASCQSCGKRFI